MANPIFIPIRFAANGLKNVIQKVLQSGQDPEDMTWNSGTPQITMIPKEDGGLPPKGQDFNGVLYTLSDHAVHRQNGSQILFSDNVVSEYGGYALGSIVQSDDTLRHYRSLIDNNTFNPNTQSISGRWEIYAGVGSIPTASSTTAGVLKVLNILTSTDTGSALSAAMGKFLQDTLALKLNTSQALGIGQTWQDVTSQRQIGQTYTNNTGKPLLVSISGGGVDGYFILRCNGLVVSSAGNPGGTGNDVNFVSAIIPIGSSYSLDSKGGINTITWTELR